MQASLNSTVGRTKLKTLESRLIGVSEGMKHVREHIARVAKTDATVLIQGESGTGKEVVAQLVHDLSDRAKGPFIPINCGAIPAELLESELFGHEKGSFTGAVGTRKGRFELAEGGTLFLDEIGDMPFPMQVKLLRVLQEKCFERVGGSKSIQSDVRIVAATHQHLQTKIDNGHFRADLYYRLSVFPIDVPPLRDRHGDVALLIDTFIVSAKKMGRGSLDIMPEAIAHLDNYSWPGNVRELSNLIERLLVLYPGKQITDAELPVHFKAHSEVLDLPAGEVKAGPQLDLLEQEDVSELFAVVEPLLTDGSLCVVLDEPIDLKNKLADLERDFIVAALDQTDWVIAHAANWLKLQRTTLVEKMRKYEISR